ncbi:MAG: ABC transporter permease [Phototrophicaceae bacterium]
MLKLITLRLLGAIPTLFILSFLTFFIVHLIPGSVAQIMLGEAASSENIAILEAELGLDDPLLIQYGRWLGGVLVGDWGESFRYKRAVAETMIERFPITLQITVFALLLSVIFGISIGVLASLSPGSWLDRLLITISSLGISIPSFWLALLLSLYFARQLGWFPVVGYTPPNENIFKWIQSLVLPAIALSIPSSAVIARQMRASLLGVLQSDFVVALRASGISERAIILKHGLKNALIPVITVIGFRVTLILDGSFVIETVFALPGLGSTLVSAVLFQDIPIIQAGVMIAGVLVVVTNLLVDISYGWLNPKVRVS